MENPAVLTWKELHAATFAFAEPFILYLEDGQLINVEKIARLMPGKRMVVFGEWQGKSVVAKLFFDPAHAKRHADKDLAGMKTLEENRIPAPVLYYAGTSHDKRVQVLIFEEIKEADNLDDIWRHRMDEASVLPVLQSVIVELATQHVFGIIQHDLHLQNFLVTEKVIYTLDGGQIETRNCLLSKKQSMENLALFLSQLGVGVEKCQENLLQHYAKARGWVLKKDDMVDIFIQVKHVQQQRWQKYEKKIGRESSRFTRLRRWGAAGMANRHLATPELMQLLQQPETLFQQPGVKMLKAGRSSTVAKIHVEGRDLVVKRYNMKSIWHWLRRCLRPTRAANSWRLAHKMDLFGIKTAMPVAYIESRYFGLRGSSYYISEYVPGEDIVSYFSKHFMQPHAVSSMVMKMVQLLRGMHKLELSHGDLKATNILINTDKQPVFIDLDGTVEHASLSGLRNAWAKEIKRFLRNFDDMPTVQKRFAVELKK